MKTALCLCADAGHETLVTLVLVGVIGTIKSIGSVALLRKAELPIKAQSIILVIPLIVELSLPPPTVERSTIAPATTSADAVREAF